MYASAGSTPPTLAQIDALEKRARDVLHEIVTLRDSLQPANRLYLRHVLPLFPILLDSRLSIMAEVNLFQSEELGIDSNWIETIDFSVSRTCRSNPADCLHHCSRGQGGHGFTQCVAFWSPCLVSRCPTLPPWGFGKQKNLLNYCHPAGPPCRPFFGTFQT